MRLLDTKYDHRIEACGPLSALGLYAVTAYGVSRRTSEIGIRMALGAQRSQVVWLFLKGTLTRVALGLTMGVVGAIAVGHLLRGLLVQRSALDPVTFAIVIVLSTTVALIASLVPHPACLRPRSRRHASPRLMPPAGVRKLPHAS